MSDETNEEPEEGSKEQVDVVREGKWMRVYERGPVREARALPGAFTWNEREFEKGDVLVRDPESKEPVGVYGQDELTRVFLQAPEDRDQQAQLRVLLYGLMQACDRVLVKQGTSPSGKQVGRMVSDLLERYRRKEVSSALVMRTLAGGLLSLFMAQDDHLRREAVRARREEEKSDE